MYPTPEKTDEVAGSLPRVLVVGAGALGCAALRTLARDGSVAITLVDFDCVEISNLQRQVLYDDADLGRLKVEAAAARIAEDFGAAIDTAPVRFDRESGAELLAHADLVLDATDDPETKFLIGRLCAGAGTPSVYGGVARTGGQWMLVVPGESACLECVFPARGDAAATAAGCAALGILAPVAGFVGSMQAITALTFLHERERAVAGRLHVYELTGRRSRYIDFRADPMCRCSTAQKTSDRSIGETTIAPQGAAARTAHEGRFEENRS